MVFKRIVQKLKRSPWGIVREIAGNRCPLHPQKRLYWQLMIKSNAEKNPELCFFEFLMFRIFERVEKIGLYVSKPDFP